MLEKPTPLRNALREAIIDLEVACWAEGLKRANMTQRRLDASQRVENLLECVPIELGAPAETDTDDV